MITNRFIQTPHILVQWPRPYHRRWLIGLELWGLRFNGTGRLLPVAAWRAVWAALTGMKHKSEYSS